ncbi:YcfL family protein [Pasteurella sp. P03HT]
MKKRTALFLTGFLMVGCSSHKPTSLLHTTQPILNIEADAEPIIEAQVSPHSAWIKNKSKQPHDLTYRLFWYDEQGVSQQELAPSYRLRLNADEKQRIELNKPTEKSANYRLYIRLK